MFRKSWKQLKILIALIIVLACLPHSILPRQAASSTKDEFESYLKLNESEQRLLEFKDDDEALKLKIEQLSVINKSRNKYHAQPVRLDILASRAANKISHEAAENKYVGHWNMAGEKPYIRYGLAGGLDHVSENAFGEWSSDNYTVSASLTGSMMKEGHLSFMSERSPNDGHKKNIIDKMHNYVGIGYYFSGNQFRYYEEFIDRYLEFGDIPSTVKPGDQFDITIKTGSNGYLYYMVIYHEKFPDPLTPAQITGKGSYADYTSEQYKKMFPWDLSRYRNENVYNIPLSLSAEGYYYIQFYTDKKEITKPVSFSTKGKVPVSGIVIKVKN